MTLWGLSLADLLVTISGYGTLVGLTVVLARSILMTALGLRNIESLPLGPPPYPEGQIYRFRGRSFIVNSETRVRAWRVWLWRFERLWWLAFVAVYIPTSLSNVYLELADHGLTMALAPEHLAYAFRLNRLWDFITQSPVIAIPLLLVITFFIIEGRDRPEPIGSWDLEIEISRLFKVKTIEEESRRPGLSSAWKRNQITEDEDTF